MAAYRYSIEVRHDGLHKYRVISGTDPSVVRQKADAQIAAWNEMWEARLCRETARAEREAAYAMKEEKKQIAEERTAEAQEAIEELEHVLQHTLTINDAIDWNMLKDTSPFGKTRPRKRTIPAPEEKSLPQEPDETSPVYQPQLNILDKLFRSRVDRKVAETRQQFAADHVAWEKKVQEINNSNKEGLLLHERLVSEEEKRHASECSQWERERDEFVKAQGEKNIAIEERERQYLARESDAISDYCDLVLTRSDYPDTLPREFDVEYIEASRMVVVDYQLPSPDDLPQIKEVKYIQSKDEFRETTLSDSERNRLYDSLVYQIAIRTLHELFEADVVDAIGAITFNGWVKYTDKGTGQEKTSCIITVQTTKEAFLEINLANVDPKQCFKTLKGIGSARLYGLSPVAPLLQINREDKRFVAGYSVVGTLDEGTNIAAIDWEDFEHLVRELFEKEFSSSGGEVKVTRASRDGGVDAVAFDPDPLRGGKIVIQAKRYTNTVGVAAVRDLYGTVINEGATKGILITTAEYGPDAYDFAKGKPLTLLTGGNLLHLLLKHGYKARIDLKEAKQVLAEQEKKQN